MNNLSRRDLLFIFLGAVLVIYVGYLAVVKLNKTRDTNIATTSFYSPLVKADDSLVVNYGGSADPNTDSVIAQYKFFAIRSSGLTTAQQASVQAVIPDYVTAYVQPAFGVTYIHVVKNTVVQKSNGNVSFNFYIDSPETYFHYDNSVAGTSPVNQIPWEGIK